MALMDFNRATLAKHVPGHRVEVFSHDTGALITSGVIDAGGEFTYTYPASLGPSYVIVRPDTQAVSAWAASSAVVAGALVAAPDFPGAALRCVKAGTTGALSPTPAANRLYGQTHRKAVSSYLGRCIIRPRGGNPAVTWYGDSDLWNASNYDGNPYDWPAATMLELAITYNTLAGLNHDGTVYFAANGVSVNHTAMYNAVKLWSGIVKIWSNKYSLFAMKYDGTLYVAHETTGKGAVDTLISNNANAKYPIEGARDSGLFSLVLSDGTVVSNNAEINTRAAGKTGVEYAYQNYKENLVLISNQGKDAYLDQQTGDKTKTLTGIDEWMEGHGGFYALGVRSRQGDALWGWEGAQRNTDNTMFAALLGIPMSRLGVYSCLYQSSTSNSVLGTWTPHGKGDWYYNRFNEGHWGAAELDNPIHDMADNRLVLDGSVLYYLEEPEAQVFTPQLERITQEGTAVSDGVVSGTVSVQGSLAERDVVVISAAKQGAARAVVGNATSDPDTGEYSATLAGFTDPVYLVCFDTPGAEWAASTSYYLGNRAYPSASGHTGLVYEVTTPGTSGATEPTWPSTVGLSVSDGSVTWTAIEHQRAQVHGPVEPGII